MESRLQLHRVCQVETRRWLLVVVLVAVTHLLFQFLLLPYGNALRSMLPDGLDAIYEEISLTDVDSSAQNLMVRNPLTVDISSFRDKSVVVGVDENTKNPKVNGDIGLENDSKENTGETENNIASEEDDKGLKNDIKLVVGTHADVDGGDDEDDDFPFDTEMERNETFDLDIFETEDSNSTIELATEATHDFSLEQKVKSNHEISTSNNLEEDSSLANEDSRHANNVSIIPPVDAQGSAVSKNISNLKSNGSSSVSSAIVKSDFSVSANGSVMVRRKKMRYNMPPVSVTSIDEMNNILARHRRSSRAMRPRWSSPRDQEILSSRSQIESAPVLVNDQDLYAPLYRNVSRFKRSYELMERTLKVYVYKDGKRPIFHTPIMKGLYASEGWFMKLMQKDKHFIVKDPRKAHLFYMPFSSRMLEYTLYVRNSHNRTNLRQYLREYSDKLAAKYPYWNRTGGADHFLVACHDWAPYETRHHMEHCIKALCNADVTAGFKIGRDVSLPETYVRLARNPLRDLGGKPASRRQILAFYAGNMHGYLRPILVNYWKDKDPSMKILGPMRPGVASKMTYIQHMKSSKYCICPKGYEVNSPRVVEAIFYECVPVIISDNFVPPLFDVLDWSSFSLILAEKDIPNLKEILLSIPEKKYLEMQLAVKKVQRHFLWHTKPMKYDLFYMTLHSIWYNRVYQIKAR